MTLPGIAVIKIFFQPTANIQTALAQVTAIEQAQLKQLLPGITPPLVIATGLQHSGGAAGPVQPDAARTVGVRRSGQHPASAAGQHPRRGDPVPVRRQVQATSRLTSTRTRCRRAACAGRRRRRAERAEPDPAFRHGQVRATEYTVKLNGSTDTIAALNDLPIRTVNGATTTIGDVGFVRDGFAPQTNIVRQDGQRGVLLSVLKNGGASTLDIMSNLRALLPTAAAQMPKEISVKTLFDQSVFVKAAVAGVVTEALIAAGLTAALVLLFLGNWRSTLVIALTIPLSILSSVIILQVMGETLNLMTLGGLGASVGVLVDQAIVTIENIERHLHLGTSLEEAIIVGAGEIGVPAFVSTLCICIVFVPMFWSGVARFLFVPMAEAVVFAMAASYIHRGRCRCPRW